MDRLSGDQTAPPSPPLVLVIRRGAAPPAVGASHRSFCALSVSYAGSTRENRTHLPSGLTMGAPTRFIIQIASWVIGALPCAPATCGDRKPAAAIATAARLEIFMTPLRNSNLAGREPS